MGRAILGPFASHPQFALGQFDSLGQLLVLFPSDPVPLGLPLHLVQTRLPLLFLLLGHFSFPVFECFVCPLVMSLLYRHCDDVTRLILTFLVILSKIDCMRPKPLKYKRIALVAEELGVPRTTLISAMDRGEIKGAETACGLPLIDPEDAARWAADDSRRPGRKPAKAGS